MFSYVPYRFTRGSHADVFTHLNSYVENSGIPKNFTTVIPYFKYNFPQKTSHISHNLIDYYKRFVAYCFWSLSFREIFRKRIKKLFSLHFSNEPKGLVQTDRNYRANVVTPQVEELINYLSKMKGYHSASTLGKELPT